MTQSPIAMLFTNIATYETALETVAENGWEYPVFFSGLEGALDLANDLVAHGVKVIISRGGVAALLQRSLSIPVVYIKYTYYDFALSLEEATSQAAEAGKVAIVTFTPAIAAARRAEKYLALASLVRIENPEDLDATLERLGREGVEVVIGGHSVVTAAPRHSLKGVPMRIQPYSILEAVEEAEHILTVFYEKETRLQIISSILNDTTSGIVALDHYGCVTNINASARRILKAQALDVLGRNYMELFPYLHMIKDALKGEPSYRMLVEHDNDYMVVSCVPITVGKTITGAVINIQGGQEIRILEGKIRKKDMRGGHVAKNTLADIIGSGPALAEAKEKARTYAEVDSTVLISGETGTGKELFAQSIHNASTRRFQPFVAVNCAALPQNLLTSELFGYVKGAFTGARAEGKMGIFEMAHNGTIFLDEISAIPLEVQAHLLRVIQEREVVRLGGEKVTPVDVRILTATNKNLLREIDLGNFREDLYYRLCVLVLEVPPLRERDRDISFLARHFAATFAAKYGRPVRSVADDALNLLQGMPFPGNVRELSGIMERAVILCRKDTLDRAELERALSGSYSRAAILPEAETADAAAPNAFARAETSVIRDALAAHNGNRARAAQALGVSRSTLWRKMVQHNI